MLDRDTYTVDQFCASHHIGRTHLYELLKRGQAPRLMKVGRRTLISREAAAEWRRAMEAPANQSDRPEALWNSATPPPSAPSVGVSGTRVPRKH
jgi:predicted DNA-binding transcriptional regulator AlpA